MNARHRAPRERPAGPWTALLTLPFVALVIPADLVFSGPLKSNGWPPRIIIFWITAAIILGWVARRGKHRASPAEVGCWIMILGLSCATAAAGLRHLSELEAAGVLRVALVMFPLAVVALGIAATADRVMCDLLLVGLLFGATVSSLIAIAQFITPFEWEQMLRLPGLEAGHLGNPEDRGGFFRVKGASGHPIEFGVIAGALAPVGLHMARFAASPLARQVSAVATVIMVLSIPMSVSRSGILVLLVALAIYAVAMTPRQRLTALVLGLAGLVLFRATIPGLLGTVLGVFTGAGEDTSVAARTKDYAIVNSLFESSPFLGRGLGTFLPEQYFFLDNQYLMSLVEGGVVLLLCTVAWLLLSMISARGAARRALTRRDESRAQAAAAAVAAIGISGLFFDLFSFAQCTVVLFLLVGISGALWHNGVEHGGLLLSPLARIRLRGEDEHEFADFAVSRKRRYRPSQTEIPPRVGPGRPAHTERGRDRTRS